MTSDGTRRRGAVGLWGAVAIGVGGMVGGGIFAVLGLSVQVTGGGAPVAFLIAGLLALITARSYARLSRSYPSRGGTVTFVNRGFGTGLFSGGINVLLWLSYVIMLSLYAQAFGSYGATFFPAPTHTFWKHVLLSAAILLLALLNAVGATAVARVERLVVGIKVAILVVFVAVGVFSVETARIAPTEWATPVSLVAGGMLIFLAYEGFELIANAGEDVDDPGRTLTRAFYISVVFVIVLYVLIAVVAVGSLPVPDLVDARDYALAAAARPAFGQAGFALISVTAMLSTASAINATLYGSARLSYTIAQSRELPQRLERPIWNRPIEGLLLTTGATLLAANLLDLRSISTTGSGGFLLVFAVVNAAEARTARQRGGTPWVAWVACAACLLALAVLLTRSTLGGAAVLAGLVTASFATEAAFRRVTHRPLRLEEQARPSG